MHATINTLRRAVVEPLTVPRRRGEMVLPEKWRSPRHALTSVTILAWTVRLSGLINLLASLQPRAPGVITWLSHWMPFEISRGRPLRMVLAAILLFALSSGLERGKRVPWLLTLATLIIAPLMHLGRAVIWPQMLLNLPLIILLVANRRFFVAKTSRESLRSALVICPALLVALLIFGTVRLHDLRFETSGPDSWGGCFQAACELVLVHNAETQQAQTPETKDFFFVLRSGGNTVGIIALLLCLRPALRPRDTTIGQEERVARFLAQDGQDPLHVYALMEDKNFFFSAAKTAVIPYVMSGRFAVTLGGPIGSPEGHADAVREFTVFCRHQDWVPLFYQVTEESMEMYRTLGFSSFQIGEDARIETAKFDLRGGGFQNLRTLCNRAAKEGLRFEWHDGSRAMSDERADQLAEISRTWLDRKNGNEMSFDMGSFSREKIRRSAVGVALNAEGRAVAFTTWRPFAGNRGLVLDLMRALPSARNVLDFVLVESIKQAREQGVSDISLGNAPLAHAAEEFSPTSVEDRAVRFIYENLNHVYAYKPLFEFKRKYRPQWRARYLAYPGGESLPLIGLALVRVHTRRGPWKFLTG